MPGAAPGLGKSSQDPHRASDLSLGFFRQLQVYLVLSRYPGWEEGGWSATNTLVIAVSGVPGGSCLQALILKMPGQASARVAT